MKYYGISLGKADKETRKYQENEADMSHFFYIFYDRAIIDITLFITIILGLYLSVFSAIMTLNASSYPYDIENNKEKTEKLFSMRKIADFLHIYQKDIDIFPLKEILQALQYKYIFRLDEIAEANRDLEDARNVINTIWKELSQEIDKITLNRAITEGLLNKMLGFLRMESSMRQGESPTNYTIDSFYELKICDIYLQRRLGMKLIGKTLSEEEEESWNLFDILGEIIDDLEDLEEDATQINSNRFLISCHLHGLEHTFAEYKGFVEKCAQYFQSRKGTIPVLLQKRSKDYFTQALYLLKSRENNPLPQIKKELLKALQS